LPETSAGPSGSVDGLLRSARAGHQEKTAEDLTMTSCGPCSLPGWATEPISRPVSSQKSPRPQQH